MRTTARHTQRYAALFGSLGHEVRLAIVRGLLASHPTGRVAGDLQADLRIPGSTLSHHLEALLSQGLIEQQREGRFLRYRASTNTLRDLLDFLYAECCAPAGLVPAIGRGAGTAAVPLYD